MNHRRVLIDASNLHSGGGVQVAASFINELGRLADRPEWFGSTTFRVSSSVALNLESEMMARAEIRDERPSLKFLAPRLDPPFDVVLSIFGPTYRRREGRVEIAGLADPTVPPGYAGPGVLGQVDARAKAKTLVKRARVRSADHVVVETDSFARSLGGFGVSPSRVTVVPNVASRVVLASPRPSRTYPIKSGELTLLYPSRPYPHKNHDFLGPFVEELVARGIKARVLVTLTEAELASLAASTRRACVPIGVVTQTDLASIYARADGVIFPSLLEVASAAPLEALGTGTPLFASDREFIREQAGDAGWYFDPRDPGAAADVVSRAYACSVDLAAKVDTGLAIAGSWPTARDRAIAYVGLVNRFLDGRRVTVPGGERVGSRSVWVVHPAQQHSMRTAAAVKQAGYELTYLTPVYDRRGALTQRLSGLLRGETRARAAGRRNDALSDHDVVQVHEGLALVLLALQRLPGSRAPFKAWFRLLTAAFNAQLVRRAKREPPDAVIAYDTFAADLFKGLARANPSIARILDMSAPAAPYMDTVLNELADHDGEGVFGQSLRAETAGLFHRANLRYTRREIAAADHFLVASEFTAGSLRALGVPDHRIHRCRYGAPVMWTTPTKPRVVRGPVRVAFVGTCTPSKGIAQFVELARTMGPGFEFVAVGALLPNSPVPSDVPEVRWTGHVPRERVLAELARSDVLYFPTLGDGFGLSVVEAMGAANVVICSANAGASDVIVDGENGFIVSAGQVAEAVEHLRTLGVDRLRLARMQEQSSRTAAGLTWQAYDDAVSSALHLILGQEGRA